MSKKHPLVETTTLHCSDVGSLLQTRRQTHPKCDVANLHFLRFIEVFGFLSNNIEFLTEVLKLRLLNFYSNFKIAIIHCSLVITKGHTSSKNLAAKSCRSACDLLLPPDIKGL